MKSLIKKERFDKIYDLIRNANFAGDIHPEESKIRLELPLVNGKSQYIFNIKKDAEGVRECTLDRNDVFTPNQWLVYLALRDDANPQIEKVFTYVPVNDGVNPSIHPVAFVDDHAEALYAGQLQWLVDNAVMLSSYPMEKFHKVPRTQGAFVLDSNDAAVQEGIQSEWSLDQMAELIIPRMTIAGTRDHKIAVNFDASTLTFGATTGYTPYIGLMMDGFLVKGGCEYKGGINPFGDVVGQW